MCRVQLFYDTPLSLYHAVAHVFPRSSFLAVTLVGGWKSEHRGDRLQDHGSIAESPTFSFPSFHSQVPFIPLSFLFSLIPLQWPEIFLNPDVAAALVGTRNRVDLRVADSRGAIHDYRCVVAYKSFPFAITFGSMASLTLLCRVN